MRHPRTFALLMLTIALAGGAWFATRPPRAPEAAKPTLPVVMEVPNFTMTDQDGKSVTRESLKGHPFVLDFIFTSCTEFCIDMTKQMAKVRTALGPSCEVKCVSMSVDPRTDTPLRLKTFATNNGAVDPRWIFLTGERRTVGTVMQALYLAPSGDPAKLNPAQHSSRLVLVDGQGRVRGFYTYDDDDARQRLVNDAKALEAKEIE